VLKAFPVAFTITVITTTTITTTIATVTAVLVTSVRRFEAASIAEA